MADPFSIAVSAVTLVQTTSATAKMLYKLIQEWRHAPLELLQLSNEMGDLRLVLSHVERTCAEIESSANTLRTEYFETLTTILEETKHQVDNLDLLLETMFTGPTRDSAETRRLGWLLKRNRVKRVTIVLRSLKGDIHLLLTSHAT